MNTALRPTDHIWSSLRLGRFMPASLHRNMPRVCCAAPGAAGHVLEAHGKLSGSVVQLVYARGASLRRQHNHKQAGGSS